MVKFKFWEIFLTLVAIQTENKKNYIIIDNFKGVLKEILLDEIVNIDPYNNEMVSLEILLENHRRFLPLTEKIPFISLKNSLEFQMNINMKSLKKSTSSNEKICLKDIILTYNENFKINPTEIYKKRYNQVFLKEISMFIKTKIQNESSQNPFRRNSLEIASNRLVMNNFQEKIKLNQKIKFQGLYSNRNSQFMLIYQAVFTKTPRKIISILFSEEKNYFLVFLYSCTDCTHFKQKIRIRRILHYIPFLEEMIGLRLLHKVGDQIFKVFKNSLLYSTYYKFNFDL